MSLSAAGSVERAVSTKRTVTRRRDQDPVRVYDDGRLAYWTGGKPGTGERKMERCGSRENAELRAEELRSRFENDVKGVAPKANATLDDLAQAALDALRKEHAPIATIRQYRSEWNCHIPAEVGAVSCREASVSHYNLIFSNLVENLKSEHVVRNVARTVGFFIQFGVDNEYFPTDPFGGGIRRKGIVKKYRAKARKVAGENGWNRVRGGDSGKTVVSLTQCPTTSDVNQYAAAFEAIYPGYGRRLVFMAFGAGLRIGEVLALKADSIDFRTLDLQVDWQLDRSKPWPAVKRPKGGKVRTSRLWSCYADVAKSLVEDAEARSGVENGWLFPRHRSVSAWLDQAGKLAGVAASECDWEWTFHWLRHAFASWSLAPRSEGGYGFAPSRVQEWLGHGQLSTTVDEYVHKPGGDDSHTREVTSRFPGR